MGDKDDYLTCYRVFFENFAATVNPEDQLPVNIAGYTITESELPGEVIYWTTQYLSEKQCPLTLITPLRRIILDEVLVASKKFPKEFGYNPDESEYIALRLMQATMARANDVCLRYLDNSRLDTLPPPALVQRDLHTVAAADKNLRRVMEDRHVVIGNLEALFGIEATEPTSFYAVYDGHAGSAAATYCAAHLHQYLVESPHFATDLRRAMSDAFLRTDAEFVRKSNQVRARGGSTAVAVAVRGRQLLAAWAGDSLALLTKRMRLMQLVRPHKPDREDERERIMSSGGTVMYYGTWRVNGQLAVSRAIGDAKYKPYVTARPEITMVDLDGDEDFVVVACDGLWDFVREDEVAITIYAQLTSDPDDLKAVTKRLIAQAKREGSPDNISIIVVFLKDPRDIVAYILSSPMDLGLDNALSNAPPYVAEAESRKPDAVVMGMDECGDAEAEADADNGVSDSDSEDLGPETAVDADDADVDVDARLHEPAPPTPPAHAVEEGHVDGVLVDNVAESGEDSEDEWNYYKGEGEPERDELNPSEEADEPPRSDTPCQDNSAWESSSVDMNSSPLNPDAPVFVPGAAAGSDVLLAESPRKPLPMDDIELPDVAQFQTEAVVRPAELLDLDNSDHLNGHHNVSIDSVTEQHNGNDKCNMDSLKFGFNIDVESDKIKDTGFLEQFERIQKDTTDYCDIQVFQAHTETNPFDDEDKELFERLKNKERDPMSMSFYQEKDDDTCERFTKIEGHIDLNAVQPLPDSDDEDIQQNGASDSIVENDKENVSPDQNIVLLSTENIHEPNNDIVKFDDRTDIVETNNVTNIDNFMHFNINDANNMQSYSNVEFECGSIPQDVLQTDTPESHKLMFEQIPEIPDGKSSELGFTNEDLQDHSESERDIRASTPQDEISQDIEIETQLEITSDLSVNIEKEKDIQLESEYQQDVKNEFEFETASGNGNMNHPDSIEEQVLSSSQSAIIDQTEAIMHQVPSDMERNYQNEVSTATEEKDFLNEEKADLIENEIIKDTPVIQLEGEFLATQAEDKFITKSPSPSESPTASPLPSETPLPVEHSEVPSSPTWVTKSSMPIEEITEELQSKSPLPAQPLIQTDSTFEETSPVPKEESPLSPLPAEVPLPRESPVPSDSPLPQATQCVEEGLLIESSLPSDSPLPIEAQQVADSSLAVESPVPSDNLLVSDTVISVKPTSLAGSPLPTEDSLLRESPLPVESLIQTESLVLEQTVPSESPLPTTDITMEKVSTTDQLTPPTQVNEGNDEFVQRVSPETTELLQPRESPSPIDQIIPKSPLLSEPSPRVSPLPTESNISESTLPIDEIQTRESLVPQEFLPEHKSPIPDELSQTENVETNTTNILIEQLHSESESVLQSELVEPSLQSENTAMLTSTVPSEILTSTETTAPTFSPIPPSISPAPVASPMPAKSPVPLDFTNENIRHSDMEDKEADLICESRLTPTVPEVIIADLAETELAPQTETSIAETTTGPTPDIVPDERVDLPQTRSELVTDIDIGIPESRAQEICVPVTSEIQHEDTEQPSAATPPPTPAVEPPLAPATLDIPPVSDTPIAADTGAIAAAAVAAAAATATAAAVTAVKTKTKTPLAKKSPTTPTPKPESRTPKTAPKASMTPRTPLSAAKKSTTASPATRMPSATKPTVARTSSTPKSATPTTKAAAAKPSTTSAKTTAPTTKPAARPATAPAKEAPAVAKAAPAARTAARAPIKPPSAKPAPTTKSSTAAKPTAAPAPAPVPRPITRPAARPAPTPATATATAATAASAAAAKPKDAKPKAPEKKPLTNGDVKPAAKPAPKPAAARPAPRPAPRAAPAAAAPAKSAVPRTAVRAPLDKQSKDLANKKITAKAAPPRTLTAKAPVAAKNAATKTGPRKVEIPKKVIAQNGLANGDAPAKPPPSPPPADNALLPDVIA